MESTLFDRRRARMFTVFLAPLRPRSQHGDVHCLVARGAVHENDTHGSALAATSLPAHFSSHLRDRSLSSMQPSLMTSEAPWRSRSHGPGRTWIKSAASSVTDDPQSGSASPKNRDFARSRRSDLESHLDARTVSSVSRFNRDPHYALITRLNGHSVRERLRPTRSPSPSRSVGVWKGPREWRRRCVNRRATPTIGWRALSRRQYEGAIESTLTQFRVVTPFLPLARRSHLVLWDLFQEALYLASSAADNGAL